MTTLLTFVTTGPINKQVFNDSRMQSDSGMSRAPTMIDFHDKPVTFKQLAKATGHKLATLNERYYRQKLRGPELWAPSKRPRTHVA